MSDKKPFNKKIEKKKKKDLSKESVIITKEQ